MKLRRFSAALAGAVLAATTMTISSASSQDRSSQASTVVGVGGAGAFIPPAHVNGPFGAGGPLAGIGGAGALIRAAE